MIDKIKSLKPSITKKEVLLYLDKKIIELKEYLEKCKKIEDGLKLELESKFITIDEVREKKNSMNKKLNELVLKIHPYAIKQMEGKDTRWFTTIKKEGEEHTLFLIGLAIFSFTIWLAWFIAKQLFEAAKAM